MKSMSIPKLVKVAEKCNTNYSQKALHYMIGANNVYTVFTAYFAVRFSDPKMFEEIVTRVGTENMESHVADSMCKSLDSMFNSADAVLGDSGILAEDGRNMIRFLSNDTRVVAINESFYEIFNPTAIFASTSAYGPAILTCENCVAAILPIKADNKNCIRAIKEVARLYS